MQLLIVPLVLAIGAFLFNRSERRNEQHIDEQRNQDATLQTYLDQMTKLLLEKKLRESQPGDEVRQVARVRTLTTLRRLDAGRRNILFRFLHDSKLTGVRENSTIDFRDVDLSRVDLSQTKIDSINFENANFEWAILCKTDFLWSSLNKANFNNAILIEAILEIAGLRDAKLCGTNLSRATLLNADLTGADLTGANLAGADLRRAYLDRTKVTEKQLAACSYLNGATLPDGTKVLNDVDNPFR